MNILLFVICAHSFYVPQPEKCIGLDITLTSDLENLVSNPLSHDEYFW